MDKPERRCEITSKSGETKIIVTQKEPGLLFVVARDKSGATEHPRYFNRSDVAGFLNHIMIFGCDPDNAQSFRYFIGDMEVSPYE